MPGLCNDIDLVKYSKLQPTKGPAPAIQAIPNFKPLVYSDKQNTPCIPTTINSSDPEALFSLFFTDSTIQMFINAMLKLS
jgi:hypothetical protein